MKQSHVEVLDRLFSLQRVKDKYSNPSSRVDLAGQLYPEYRGTKELEQYAINSLASDKVKSNG